METQKRVLDELIKESEKLFEYHLDQMTKFEQRMNILKSLKNIEILNNSMN